MTKKTDYLSNLYASRILARKIESYWHDRGHTWVNVRVESQEFGGSQIYVVRSNLEFNGKEP
jgi:hypothetical protein